MKYSLSIDALFDFSLFAHAALFEGCDYPWQAFEKLSAYLTSLSLGKMEGNVSSEAFLIDPASISLGRNSIVEAGAYIQGPCVLGAECIVRSGAYIRGDVIAGDGCVIGHGTEIKCSILLNGASAAHFNYIGNSILGKNVNLGAGVKCANFRLDHEPITLTIDGQKIKTGLKKLGALLGDGAQVGCNCVLNPGTLLGKNAFCSPCLSVSGVIPEGAIVKSSFTNFIEVR